MAGVNSQRRQQQPQKIQTMRQIRANPASPSGKIYTVEQAEIPLGLYAGGTVWLYVSAAICFVWTGIYLVNLYHIHEYTVLNVFKTTRYQWDWWFIWLMGFNIFLPLTWAHALTNNGVGAWGRIHRFFSYIVIFSNLLSLGALTVQWLFFCNGGSGYYFVCHDYRWCGVYKDSDFCPNGMNFPPPYEVTYGSLMRNPDATVNWIFIFVFMLHSWAHLAVNYDFKRYGILK